MEESEDKSHEESSPGIQQETVDTVVQVESESVEIVCSDEVNEQQNCFALRVHLVQTKVSNVWARYGRVIWQMFTLLLWMVYIGYFFYAMIHSRLKDEGSIRLLWVTSVVLLVYLVNLVLTIGTVAEKLRGVENMIAPHGQAISW